MTPMKTIRPPRVPGLPNYVWDESFDAPGAAAKYSPEVETNPEQFETKYMPDEVTRDLSKRMHFAAHRVHQAKTSETRAKWLRHYHRLRDEVVLGNRKLVYRAVRRRMAMANRADDLIGECHIVLIQAVAAFNPWLGIRFSTYAFTCLVRALSRLSQRFASDWLARSMSLETVPDHEPRYGDDETSTASMPRLDQYLRDDHPLLSSREKMILIRRFSLTEQTGLQTLEQVGRELGLSKERVRQVQASALGKLRRVLSDSDTPMETE